jgi:succinate-semialdehyde dehydrogenase/glutarate-semialdehyde dehydrogenase
MAWASAVESEGSDRVSKLLIGGRWVDGCSVDKLRDKYGGAVFGEMAVASHAQVEEAVAGVFAAAKSRVEPYELYRILMRAAELVGARRQSLIDVMRDEAGFTRADGETEVRRCVETLELSAEEAKRLKGEVVPIESAAGVKDRLGFTVRVPRGVVCAITPFNSPLNVLAHKVAPAIAGGNTVVIKPSELTPLSAVALCEVLIEAGLPPERLSLLHGRGDEIGPLLLANQQIAFYAFTGSTRIGRIVQQGAGLRGCQLELGSIASTIVCGDADLALAVPKIANAAFRKAGQVCTSVQRLMIDRRVLETFLPKFLDAVRLMKAGDPADPAVTVGPMISEAHAERATSWIQEAVEKGARLLTGGVRKGAVLTPTVLDGVDASMRVVCEEIFAPVVSIIAYDNISEAIEWANASPFGLSAGLFTQDLSTALRTARELQFGGVHINEASSARVDLMPFGGVKHSGFGREGPAYAIREMTEERLITIAF